MIPHTAFQSGLPYAEFLSTHGTPSDLARWDQFRAAVQLTESQTAILKSFTRRIDILFLGGAWCGDCAFHCPILEKFAEIAPVLNVRYLDRDVHAEVQKELQINGGNRVPVAVFFSEDGFECSRYGEKTLSEYRRTVRNLLPEGTLPPAGDRMTDAIGEWMTVVERVQWMLRLSPRLRRLHGD